MTAKVFVSVGTDHHPFDRLVGWADRWQQNTHRDAETYVQRGTSLVPPTVASCEYLDKNDLDMRMAQASVVVCHGGPSTIMGARGAGARPIVVPRDHTRGEHVDGHQLAFCDHLERHGLVWRARSEAQLCALIDDALTDPSLVRVDGEVQVGLLASTLEQFELKVNGLLGRGPGGQRLNTSSRV
ncbi:MAG: glycosyl transferase family 28 [Actinomycetia bacterium]|nr:glycosyl transferase family 28 [Actinomycetes bacterium]